MSEHRSTSNIERAAAIAIGPTRHRWAGNPVEHLYRCTPSIPSLYRSYTLLCHGCGLELRWSDIPGLDAFRGVSDMPIIAEGLGLRLDLRVCEIAIEKARAS